jgi:hypothetical protein
MPSAMPGPMTSSAVITRDETSDMRLGTTTSGAAMSTGMRSSGSVSNQMPAAGLEQRQRRIINLHLRVALWNREGFASDIASFRGGSLQ